MSVIANFKYLAVAVAVLALASCDNDSFLPRKSMVVDAWIDTDGYPVAVITSTVSPSEDDIDLEECLLRWATVTITDGVDTVKMIGTPDDNHFPPYLYKTYEMRGETGKTYTISAEYRGLKTVATSSMPEPPKILEVDFEPVKNAEGIYGATLTFRPPTTRKSYFVAFVKAVNYGSDVSDFQFYPSFLGTVTTETDKPVTMSVFRGKHRELGRNYIPNFTKGERITIKLCNVEENVYHFWEDYLNALYFDHGMFLSTPDNLIGNVIGGYGCFSACGTTSVTVTVPFRRILKND